VGALEKGQGLAGLAAGLSVGRSVVEQPRHLIDYRREIAIGVDDCEDVREELVPHGPYDGPVPHILG